MSIKAKHPPIKSLKNMTLEKAFEVMALNCIAQIESSASILATNYDIEALHQIRIGLRRLDTLLEFYKKIVKIPYEFKSELKWLNQQLSIVRNCDVLIHSTLPMIDNKSLDLTEYHKTDLAKYLAEYLEIKEKHKKSITIFSSQQYIKFVKKLTEYFLTSGWRQALSAKDLARTTRDISLIAPVGLKKQRKELITLYKDINIQQQKSIHQTRIAAKKLRYSAELLRSLYPHKRVSSYIKKLIKLQDCLGVINDIKVANQLFKKIIHIDDDFQIEKKNIKRKLKVSLKDKQQRIDDIWKSFKLATPFWET